jgi:hypothetical protein
MSFAGLTGDAEKKKRKGWSEFFWKPETRDERVKEYVPDVLEESLAEQRLVLAQQTQRDLLVEHGHKVLREIENKAPIPTLFPAVNKIMALYGHDHVITQRGLNYLLYPNSSTLYQQQVPHELVATFHDNFRSFVESVEQDGSYVHDVKLPEAAAKRKAAELEAAKAGAAPAEGEAAPAVEAAEGEAKAAEDGASAEAGEATPADGDSAAAAAAPAEEEAPQDVAEPADVTYFVKVAAGMSMANLHIGDVANAVVCCDVAIEHVMDSSRRGGLLAMKAGLLNRQKKYELAGEAAALAVAASQNPQGYIQGAAALRFRKMDKEAVALLAAGAEAVPQHEGLTAALEATRLAVEGPVDTTELTGREVEPAEQLEEPATISK